MGNLSKIIPTEHIYNLRDLGGMTGADGRKIKSGLLLRCSELNGATSFDREILDRMVGAVVDFRSYIELVEKPDYVPAGATHEHIPLFQDQQKALERDMGARRAHYEAVQQDPAVAKEHMMNTYTRFINNPYTASQYAIFVKKLVDHKDKAVLWHCAAGKDRAGFASIIVQTILGVSDQDIWDDYMSSNKYVEHVIPGLVDAACRFGDGSCERANAEQAIRYLWCAYEEYLQTALDCARERYGDLRGYVREAVGISDETVALLREKYLEG